MIQIQDPSEFMRISTDHWTDTTKIQRPTLFYQILSFWQILHFSNAIFHKNTLFSQKKTLNPASFLTETVYRTQSGVFTKFFISRTQFFTKIPSFRKKRLANFQSILYLDWQDSNQHIYIRVASIYTDDSHWFFTRSHLSNTHHYLFEEKGLLR